MEGEWREVAVTYLADLSGGFAFKSGDYSPNGRFILRTLNISDDCSISREDAVFIPEELCPKYERFALQAGDTLFVMVGATLGKVGYVREKDLPALLNQNMWRIRAKREIADARFVHYAFRHAVKASLGWASGSARDFVRRSDYRNLLIPNPPLPEQRAIAHILGTLDDKIELNRRMNETLEAMARALFKSWFVDFDPVRAKAEGRDPGLPEHIADLFPDSFEDSELGEIPRGWGVGCVDDEFDLTMGQSPPGETYNEVGKGLPFYQGRTDFSFRFPTRRVYCTAPTRFARKGDTLISVRAPVGDINMAAEDCAIGRGVAAGRHKTGSRSYSYQFMGSQAEVFGRFEAEGTVFGSISKKDFRAISCVPPPRNLVMEFERRLAAVDSRIEAAEQESRTLFALRDALLPRLISGNLRVRRAKRFSAEIR